MLFTTDQQTLDDLNIFGRHGSDSVFALFDKTATRGAATILEQMFRYPLSDAEKINKRSGIIQYFSSSGTVFPFDINAFDAIDHYLSNTDERTKLSGQEHSAAKKLSNLIAVDAETLTIHKGIIALIDLLNQLQLFIKSLDLAPVHPYFSDKETILQVLENPLFDMVYKPEVSSKTTSAGKYSALQLAEFDILFRFRNRGVIQQLLGNIYELDVYLTVAKVALERSFTFPKALPQAPLGLHLEGLYHPQVKNAVPNSIAVSMNNNVIFLTGANMAGKSTFMKSLSVAFYLAHMGFPVAATKMEFSVLNGIYTTINLPDDLGMGASHFYAEVLRAKKIANELRSKNLFIVFDELFRGTNVKDAGEATIAFTAAFARKENSIFVISTHIIEAGAVLGQKCKNIGFLYLPTVMEGTNPVYTYKLKQGITEDRHGMIIINNEGILDILNKGQVSGVPTPGPKQSSDQKLDPAAGSFIADKQTVNDLNLLGKYKPNSIYSLFNKVQTAGGERLLQQMFQHPLTDAGQINTRSSLFQYFGELDLVFPFKKEVFAVAEGYINMGTSGNYPAAVILTFVKKFQSSFLRDEQFEAIYQGLLAAIEILNACWDFIVTLSERDQNSPYQHEIQVLLTILSHPGMQWLRAERNEKVFSLYKVARYDYLLKHTLREQLETLLNSLYHLDVYLSVSNIAKERRFDYAKAMPQSDNIIRANRLWHPGLIDGIPNSVTLSGEKNMIFLTGANMAGKSTVMKSVGVAVYLAHMGFPVAAEDMKFSVLDGLYSSINVPDDLSQGYSHFYAEVLRVKKVAEEVGAGKNLLVLFDELFKGTNVKDAYDGTLAVTDAFSKFLNCFYIVSTHITEVGASLSKNDRVQFVFMPTVMNGNRPSYTYQLQRGISEDKQGLMIIKNEGILELLDNTRTYS